MASTALRHCELDVEVKWTIVQDACQFPYNEVLAIPGVFHQWCGLIEGASLLQQAGHGVE